MKARGVLIFILGVFALMGVTWAAMPAEGVPIGGITLRFPSLEADAAEEEIVPVNVDSVIRVSFENPANLYLPRDNYFDSLFSKLEGADTSLVRIVHYGDSQIELDRISADLRDALQERFGGSGTGMFPALSNVPSASISRVSNGGFVQYTMYGDSTTQRAGHSRYGVLAQVVQMTGGGVINLRGTKSKTAYDRVRSFSRVSLLYGRPSSGFSVRVGSDTLKPQPSVKSDSGVSLMTWDFGRPVEKARITLSGDAEIYGVAADGSRGVALDNVPLRGCSGTIFTRISAPLMRASMEMEDVGMVILQFGGNYMPVASSSKAISTYCGKIADQIRYFHNVAPGARILFIGPSDMGTSVGGRIVTRPRLPEMVDSLRVTALRNDAAYWDLFGMMGGENSMVQWVKHNPPYAGADYTHFTPAGASQVGQSLASSVFTCYDNYLKRK